jgi:hypothetical protein
MRGAVRILFRANRQETLYRILPNIVLKFLILERVSHSPVQKAGLPNLSLSLQILVKLKRKAALYKLRGSFQSDSPWRQDQVEMVQHHNKFVQQVFLLHSVIQQNLNEETRDLLNLKETSFLGNICGNKMDSVVTPR